MNTLVNTLTGTIIPYLLKGGLLTLATYYLGDVKRFVKSAMWQSIIQVAVFGLILFVLDRFVPNTPAQGLGQGLSPAPVQSQGPLGNLDFSLQGLQNLATNFLQQQQQKQQQSGQFGGECGCGSPQ